MPPEGCSSPNTDNRQLPMPVVLRTGKANFFERRVGEYTRAATITGTTSHAAPSVPRHTFTADAEF